MQISEALQTYFGFQAFRPGQEKVVETLVAGQSALAIFPTGAGKSLCYQLPALLLPHLTLVVSPLLALMKDQIDFLQNRGIAAARLDSSLSREDYDQILMQARQGELKILMISVERFKNERFRAQLQRLKISLLVVDEAHCISEWGHNFRPEYLKLPDYRQEFKIPQTLLLTATATPQVRADICRKFEIPAEQITLTGFYRANLNLSLTAAPESEKMQLLLNRIQEAPQAPTIVYVTLQKTAETVAQNLAEAGFQAQAYHAGLPHDEREAIQNAFLAGSCPCVVATIAFGMGIDKADIRRVIHYDLPKSLENYSQEVGRAGRDGAPARCEVLANRESVPVLENFIYGDTPEPKAIETLLWQLQTHPEPLWELKLRNLSQELDIRELPLKTLLVYLDLHGILRPKYTRFEDYSLKFIRPQSEIVSRFQGERQAFVNSLFAHSETKRVWTRVQVEPFLSQYPGADRQRVVTALEYFAEKGWIELEAKQAVETYQILSRDFDPPALTETISDLFRAKEAQEIGRIAQMLAFFRSADCLSRQLAAYFGEDLKQACGHCSVCLTGPIELPEPAGQALPDTQILAEMTAEAAEKLGVQDSVSQRSKFLCGIATPLSSRLKLKQLPHFGALESLPYAQVREQIARLLES
ncbi:recombinase RecQ [bacterium (Candidatus Blackallbacteria) CG17_big_fil_post_rev_8_21_14_2_50_48_46]|uniref:ATP-dependent DNA helicase RecQ n=1 Tax=bacterium (Candidatus Blackallbacteria) CG17_big_fil_post_rev_8_21_14_2_50_48_46 TaxID=2014261 RepID=A0A2M7FZP0_9BACT|nr:MAG: recombinase RecQ [bacterium (Candidatus Blackallbacteria) CG18_big_fil_WC_8_21_14_2_50_49_26]PIW14868.1 MAG: recombinase RecQ [bacterium (Candidatus Blackallbacteria) CG17_big_fil_post_rev_8_21_14_2_50_48_46]PIW44435.1 MAG: recombinase RecQ [bacterium (Candidatus Blackallbacteria) CG13_big_fil_rev_8_21_14_2_50_49_14]